MTTHIYGLLLSAFWLFVGLQSATAGGWTRGVEIGTWTQDDAIKHFKVFELVVWSGMDDQVLRGTCSFTNDTAAPIAIAGTAAKDGDFYPSVRIQVADATDGKWKTIGESAARGKPATVTVKPMATSSSLKVDLAVFQPFIGTAKYGRLILRSGQAATFKLETLTNPHK